MTKPVAAPRVQDSRTAVRPWVIGLSLWVVAFVPRLATALAAFPHQDERLWLRRSEHYARAMLDLDLANATSSTSGRHTMPGITTVVVGGVARVIWGGLRDLGVASFPGEGFSSSRAALVIAQVLMAAATSGLLVLLWWVLSSWATRVVATTAVLILATEPVLVADGTKLTTDSFLMLFGAIGAFGLAALLRVPANADHHVDRRRRILLAIAAGIGVGGALASKLTALTFLPFYAGVIVYAGVRAWRTREPARDLVVATGLAVLVAVVFLAVLWPASWADPSGQLDVLRGTAKLPGSGHIQFFLGEITQSPSPLFYFVIVPIRLTPWLFLLGIAGVVVSLRVRSLRGYALVALAYAAVPWITILFAEKKFERYAFIVWPVLAVLAGLVAQHVATWCRTHDRWRAFEITAAGAIAGLAVYTMLVVPYGSAYANPVLGGGPVADEVMLLGVDTAPEAGDYIRDREGDRCAERRIKSNLRGRLWSPCGDLVSSSGDLRRGDYVVLITNSTKRKPEDEVQALRDLGRRVAVIENRGVEIAEIIQVG